MDASHACHPRHPEPKQWLSNTSVRPYAPECGFPDPAHRKSCCRNTQGDSGARRSRHGEDVGRNALSSDLGDLGFSVPRNLCARVTQRRVPYLDLQLRCKQVWHPAAGTCAFLQKDVLSQGPCSAYTGQNRNARAFVLQRQQPTGKAPGTHEVLPKSTGG